MWIRESLFNLEKGYEDVWGAEILGMWVPGGGGFEKSMRSRGRA